VRRILILTSLVAAAAGALPGQQGYTVLFDGRTLDHWQKGYTNWVLENRVLALKDRSDAKEHNDNYLWTKEQYGDFVLELEYQVPANRANSGVFLRTPDTKDPVYTGIEVQVGNIPAGRPVNKNSVGGIYDLVAPLKLLHKPGEWNKYVITCKGPKITVMLNGVLSAEMDLDQWTETGQNPDGTKNKFKQPLKNFARKGYIGLQDHGLPVLYRNIRIRRLD
jgi:hypothetical protein